MTNQKTAPTKKALLFFILGLLSLSVSVYSVFFKNLLGVDPIKLTNVLVSIFLIALAYFIDLVSKIIGTQERLEQSVSEASSSLEFGGYEDIIRSLLKEGSQKGREAFLVLRQMMPHYKSQSPCSSYYNFWTNEHKINILSSGYLVSHIDMFCDTINCQKEFSSILQCAQFLHVFHKIVCSETAWVVSMMLRNQFKPQSHIYDIIQLIPYALCLLSLWFFKIQEY